MTAKKKSAKKVDRYRIEYCWVKQKWYRSVYYNDENGYDLKQASAILKKESYNSDIIKCRKVKIK